MIDNFQNKANTWDNPQKIRMTTKFSNELSNSIFLYKEDKIAEVGAGTGLVGLSIVDMVNKIYMIDNSPSMLSVLREKLDTTTINKVEIVEGELETTNLTNLDGVICYMSLHHIPDTINFIKEVKKRIKQNGFFAIGDLIEEDGSFHGSKEDLHFGFNLEKLSKLLESEGFIILRETVYDYVSKNEKNYPIFIIIAQK